MAEDGDVEVDIRTKTREGLTGMFDIVSGVKQGSILLPFLFLMVIDFVMRKTMKGENFGISWVRDY